MNFTCSPSNINEASALTETQLEVIRGIRVFTSGLSILGTAFIITVFLLFRALRNFNRGLVVVLCALNFGKAASSILTAFYWMHDSTLVCVICQIQASGLQYFDVSSSMWAAVIATYLFFAIYCEWVRDEDTTKLKRIIYWMAPFALGIPLVPVILGHILHVFGASVPGDLIAWCWVLSEYKALRMAFDYGPQVVIWIYNIILYAFVMQRLKSVRRAKTRRIWLRISCFVLVSIIVNVPSLVNRIQNLISPSKPVFILYFIQAAAAPLEGFLDALVYPSATFREELNRECRNCCHCSVRRTSQPLNTVTECAGDPLRESGPQIRYIIEETSFQ